MISVERCKEILGEDMTDSEVLRLRDSLYAMVESILDNYFEEFATIDICKKQSFTAESPAQDKALKDTALIAKNIAVESMPHRRAMMS
ncbi:MAG: hypothetical protein A2431_00630 [Candidatus Zambryskibacteria bacterium RIFOXYC1_FULL_39_10]|uniref:Uncharacterized protein n=1 Tax=Candidatus Zambryskibacteria bacterium RIFOXYC1_FULL_39_10 TaxID=1802779 RepID=A0A1G2UZA2_9BACT|nr:MAG: hypothetical protein A2431_00630 [Candidatus Zambryskibacteria bacterium RIFOXYC1_FULL_39_10]OHB15649.1 MAG: hypothetical protein A2605_02490 [Candidatus Zambryskibacteria bacterium RIFOXYD1_FULL_39_35]